jgi:hypothetical protein
MTRLMCSSDRQEVETLKSKLFRAGIRSEIRSNPLACKLGFTQLDIFIEDRDLFGASKVRQSLGTVVSADGAPGSSAGGRRTNDSAEVEESELVTDVQVLSSPATEPPRPESPGPEPGTGGAKPESEFAQATALLEKEVEELLVHESKLADRCFSLVENVKALDESLAQARTDLAREVSNRSSAEAKLTEVGAARALLEKEMRALEVRFKASELKSANLEDVRKSLECQLSQQAQQWQQLLSQRREEYEYLRVCVGRVNDLRSRVRAKLVPTER